MANTSLRSAVAMIAWLLSSYAVADEFHFDRLRDWQAWTSPIGAIQLQQDGRVELGFYGTDTDPMDDMSLFSHPTRKSGEVFGGLTAQSNNRDARFLADNDHDTWWQPAAGADPDDAWLHIDLGRIVMLKEIRLVFPDTLALRPFRDFSVFVTEGSTVSSSQDVWRFNRIFTTTEPNELSEITIPLTTEDLGGVATGENLVTDSSLDFMPVHYIRFLPHEVGEGAALAEIEVTAIGENIALQTFDRGGTIRSGLNKVEEIRDGSVDKAWPVVSPANATTWQDGGMWFEWDLGALFHISRIVFYQWPPNFLGRTTFGIGGANPGYSLEMTDGTPIARDDPFRSPFDYTRVSLVDNSLTPRRYIFDHQLEDRVGRYLFWNSIYDTAYLMYEVFIYSAGYPAQATLTSDFIDLGGTKSITGVSWDADTPPGTRITVQTRTGNELDVERFYHKKNGEPVTEAQYNKLPKVIRGEIVEVPKEGGDWSGWSEPHLSSGQPFQSPTPRQLLRMQVSLETDDPGITPVLNSVTLHYDDALVQKGIEASIFPREVMAGEWQDFRYVLQPTYTVRDRGFDRVVLPVPGEVRDVSLRIDGEEFEGIVESTVDSLIVAMPRRVQRDSVEVMFTARLLRNPTRFLASVGNSALPGNLQDVKPRQVDDDGDGEFDRTDREALFVFLPDVTTGGTIRNLAVSSRVITPNGDAINDDLRITFDLFRTEIAAELRLYDLAGRLLRVVSGQPGKTQQLVWDGMVDDRSAVPGIYVCRVEVQADAGKEVETLLVNVAY
jgi:hypothetical protein